MARIQTAERLRQIIGEPRPTTRHKITAILQPEAVDFIHRSSFLFLATASADGQPDVSPKGDHPGFVVVEDPSHLLIPERPGNRLIMGLQNILANPAVAIIFLVPGTEETLRVAGRAELLEVADPPQPPGSGSKPPLLNIRVVVERCFFHCARAFKRARLWEPGLWPPAQPFSFGTIMARNLGQGDDVAKQIDTAVEDGYRNEL